MEHRIRPNNTYTDMNKDKLRSSIRGASKGEGISSEILNYSSSVVDPKETPEEISDKISKLVPDMKSILGTGLIKNTESFKESKNILVNFKEGLANSSSKPTQYDYTWQEPDGRPALEQTIDSLQKVVENMLRAGLEVPPIYRDFLHTVRPPKPEPIDVQILEKPPLFKITGLDENGEVKVETDTPLVLKKGKSEIALTHEKLINTLFNSQKVDCKIVKEMQSWIKNNLHRVDSLEKIDDNEWNKLRTTINDYFNKQNSIKKNTENITSDDVDDIIEELENELLEEPTKKVEETKVKIEVPKSINLNAYEIRLQILKEALEWVKHNKNTNKTDDVLDVANKFYKFVEQRKNGYER